MQQEGLHDESQPRSRIDPHRHRLRRLAQCVPGCIAPDLSVSIQVKVKKIIEAENIEPDEVKRNCKYYGEETAAKMKSLLETG